MATPAPDSSQTEEHDWSTDAPPVGASAIAAVASGGVTAPPYTAERIPQSIMDIAGCWKMAAPADRSSRQSNCRWRRGSSARAKIGAIFTGAAAAEHRLLAAVRCPDRAFALVKKLAIESGCLRARAIRDLRSRPDAHRRMVMRRRRDRGHNTPDCIMRALQLRRNCSRHNWTHWPAVASAR